MALKRILTKEEHAKLVPQLQGEYKAEGESMVLDLTDYEDPAVLKRAKDHEKDARKLAEKTVKELQDQLSALTDERDGLLARGVKKEDVERLENSHKDKLAKREKELTSQIDGLNGELQTLLVDNVANGLATKLSTAPALMLPHIKSRLKVERVEGKAVTRILDKDGKLSAATVEDLEKEFIANPDFSAVLTGSKGSGGGANGNRGGGAVKKLSDMTATEEAQFANQNPTEYARLLEADKR